MKIIIRALKFFFMTISFMSFSSHVLAVESSLSVPAQGNKFATVIRIHGVVVTKTSGKTDVIRKLNAGDVIYVGEQLSAKTQSEALLKTEDAGMVAIRPNTDFVVEKFVAEDKPTDGLVLRLIVGSLRVITGWIGHTNQPGYLINTSTALIGIRGTDHEPFVLSAELAAATSNREGTYDKVNRGGTSLSVGDNKVDIDPGKVGFAPSVGKVNDARALLTLLIPVLLEKVPNFYVPGQFDSELDIYSLVAQEKSLLKLEERRKTNNHAPAGGCAPDEIAKVWLSQLDSAILRNDAPTIVAMFASDVKIRANFRDNDGKITAVDLERDELAKSSIASMKELKDYSQRRVLTEAKSGSKTLIRNCDRITLKSEVVEQGRQADKPFRFESLEEYNLELREGKWIAIKAETTQH